MGLARFGRIAAGVRAAARRWWVPMLVLGLGWPAGAVRAQDPGQQTVGRGGMGQFAGMQRVAGEVTALSGANVTVKTEEGKTVTIVTTDNTRLMKGRGEPVKLADIKVGDGVMAVGNLDAPNDTLHAAAMFATDGARLRELRANLGKTYIAGRVTAIDLDNAKMTVERPDHVSQTIGFDESTSFRKGGRGRGSDMGTVGGSSNAQSGVAAGEGGDGGESITLADIKVGDEVRGTGSVKNGVFVPTQLVVRTPGAGRRAHDRGSEGPPAASPNPQPGSGPGPGSR